MSSALINLDFSVLLFAQIVFRLTKLADKTTLCATIVPGDNDGGKGAKIMERVVSSCYEACRSGRRELESFPDFQPLLSELKGLSEGDGVVASEYKVCSCLPCGSLVIRPQFFDQFSEMPEFDDLVKRHNKTFNKDDLVLSAPTQDVPQVEDDKVTKAEIIKTTEAIKAETIASLANSLGTKGESYAHILIAMSSCVFILLPVIIPFSPTNLREVLQINSQISLVVDMDHESAYFKADVAEQCVLLDLRELFSFGAGSWFDGTDAKDLIEQGDGKWIKCSVNLQTPILLERKRMSEHLNNLDWTNHSGSKMF